MDNLPVEQTPPEQKPSIFQELEFGVGGVLLGVGTFLLMLFVLNYFNIVSLSLVFPNQLGWLPHRASPKLGEGGPASQNFTQRDVPPGTSPTPTPPLVSNLETCDVKKEGNPLVNDVKTIEGSIIGSFRGNINAFEYNLQDQSASLELISPRGDQKHTFNLIEEEKLVYDAIELKDLALSDLKRGQTVAISFNCFPDQPKDKQFRITRVAITGK